MRLLPESGKIAERLLKLPGAKIMNLQSVSSKKVKHLVRGRPFIFVTPYATVAEA